ncbi:MAG TPA: hypothetical protein VF015_03270 [Acidimicrobiales bacterium]
MPASRIIAIGAATTAAIALGAAVSVTALDDPDRSVDAVSVSDASPADVATPAAGGGASQQVPGLDELRGTVQLDDDSGRHGSDDHGDDDSASNDSGDDSGDDSASDGSGDDSASDDSGDDSGDDGTVGDDSGHGDDDLGDELEVNGVDLDFGPDDWVATATATADFDGDGGTEALRDELAGLVGREVTLLVRFDDDGDDADVYVIDGTTYRDVSAPAPWLPAGAADDESLRAAAAAAVGEGAQVIELEPEDDGTVAWEAKVRAADGTRREVRLDAAGTVVDVRADD